MENLIDEILLSKKNKDKDVVKKTKEGQGSSTVEKILIRNIESIKRLADKEGVDINKLINHLKVGE